jgi:hypothetical protein
MKIEILHEGSCQTTSCENYAVLFDAPSLDGELQPIVCGVCGEEFTNNCTLK